jgi:hypothetical protein
MHEAMSGAYSRLFGHKASAVRPLTNKLPASLNAASRGSLFNHAVEARWEEQPLMGILRAVDDVQDVSRRAVKGDGNRISKDDVRRRDGTDTAVFAGAELAPDRTKRLPQVGD